MRNLPPAATSPILHLVLLGMRSSETASSLYDELLYVMCLVLLRVVGSLQHRSMGGSETQLDETSEQYDSF
jgi:hypothetical protein